MGISFRGIAIGVLAVIAVSLIVSYAELVLQYIQIGFLQLPPAVIGVFVFVLLANYAAQSLSKRLKLSPQDLMTVYSMMLISAMISSRGLMEKLLSLLVTPSYYATEMNQWQKLFIKHIKPWMVPFDTHKAPPHFEATRFFEGLKAGESIPWGSWAVPLLAWGILALFIFGAFLCMAAILRKQWVDNEKLSFPLTQLPLEMVGEGKSGGFFNNKLMWMGFALPAIVFSINGLHQWYPSIPEIKLTWMLHEYLVNPPFNSMGYTPALLSFAAIGFFYLLPTEMLFSLWFFFLLTRVQAVTAASYGMTMQGMPMGYPTYQFIGYQVMGAYFVLAAYFLYISRPHIKRVLAATFKRSKVDDTNELLPYRTAVIGLVLCVLGSILWLNFAGLSMWIAALEILIFLFIVALVLARSTAEGGLLMTETSFRPVDFYRMFAPTHTLGAQNMAILAFVDSAFIRDLRGLLLTGFLDGLKISDGVGAKRRSFLWVFVIAIVIAMIIAGIFQLWLPYHKSAVTLYPYVYRANNMWGFQDYEAPIRDSVAYIGWQGPVFFGVGAVVTAIIAYMRMAVSWWPFHPLGYALSASWTMIVFWMPCLVAWIIKTTMLRYGGMRMYVKARPWFLGMVLGEFSMAVIWTLLSWMVGGSAPNFPWP